MGSLRENYNHSPKASVFQKEKEECRRGRLFSIVLMLKIILYKKKVHIAL